MEFIDFYNGLIKEFEATSSLTILSEKAGVFIWPASSGVYVIWEKEDLKENNLIYIGMTGKFLKNSNGELIFNNASFKSRTKRWTPYRFCENTSDNEMKHYFRYGPKESKTSLQGQIRYNEDAYKFSIPYTKIEIHCFHINREHPEYTPVLFESLLLTKFLKSNGVLPPANNSL